MRIRPLISILVCFIVGLIGIFYTLTTKQTKKSGKPIIVCTTTIIADTISNIAGDTIDLKILMGPGVDPHLYKPVEQDIITIANADIIFYNGLHLEARMAELFEQMGSIKITAAVTRDMPQDKLIYSAEFDQFADPHVWFDPLLWTYAVQTITKVLQQQIPDHAYFYEQNKEKFIQKIHATLQTTLKQMQRIKKSQRILITGHDAFAYFARVYDFIVVSLQGISTASEAGTQDVQNLVNFIVDHKVPTIFAESCIPTRNMQALQQAVQSKGRNVAIGNELLSDALGSPDSPAATYLGMLIWNVNSIATGLT